MSKLLIFTAVNPSMVAVWEDKTVYELRVQRGRGSKFLSKVLSVFANDFKEIWVGIGPGSFTGTRVGVAYALGLAAGLELLHLHTFDTFDFLYAPYYGDNLWVILHARRGEVYGAYYENGSKVEEGVYSVKKMISSSVVKLSYASTVPSDIPPDVSLRNFEALFKHQLFQITKPEDVKVRYMRSVTEEYKRW